MYFEHVTHDGWACRDGGLRENNPVQLAVNEARKLWGPPVWSNVQFDMILSVGSGFARNPQTKPASWHILPDWLVALFNALISTMNGQDAWKRFIESQEGRTRIKDRSSRLNVKFDSDTELALDDVAGIPRMEALARQCSFYERLCVWDPFCPILQKWALDKATTLERLADRLRASVFFFQLVSITKQSEIYSVSGWIGCQLSGSTEPGDSHALGALLARTEGFWVKERKFALPGRDSGAATSSNSNGTRVPFVLDIDFSHQQMDVPVRIDVEFKGNKSHVTSISGFPMTLRALLGYRDLHWDDLRRPAPSELVGDAAAAAAAAGPPQPAVVSQDEDEQQHEIDGAEVTAAQASEFTFTEDLVNAASESEGDLKAVKDLGVSLDGGGGRDYPQD